MKLLFTGGHHNSALAVIDALESELSTLAEAEGAEIFFVGHRFATRGGSLESAEYQEVTARRIPFWDLPAGKLYRTVDPREWVYAVWGFFRAVFMLNQIRPDLIISFGGYLAAPVVLGGFLLGIPSVTHEQTAVSGWANRLIAWFSRRVFISWPESARFFPANKTVLTGLPLRREIVSLAGEATPPPSVPLALYVTGGKQGAQVINTALAGCLHQLLERFLVIHQCGALDWERCRKLRENLTPAQRERYLVKDYFVQSEIANIFRRASLVIGRSGAHTVYELAALGKPALLIPIPWASHNEQFRNAQIFETLGLARILPQERLSSQTLLASCLSMTERLPDFSQHQAGAKQLVRLDGATQIAQAIIAELKSGRR